MDGRPEEFKRASGARNSRRLRSESHRVGRQGRVQCAVRTVESCVAESSRRSLQLSPLLAAPREPRSASASRQCRAGRAADTTLRRRISTAGHSDINIHLTCPRLREHSHQHSLRERSADFALMKARQYARASPGVTECARCAARARCHAPPPSPPPASWENGNLWGTESAPVPLTSATYHTRSTCVAIHI
ncbi:hypothetical protein MSG28_003422 [Choristoneura fumiferana]|uniref:Uncharacterized protein n=1 Tax=Choristoneura fumiferana TaxID=7141 RepID=A0ACC0KEM7_CHOFU|nr:hypothetical protein MSG28_003422 [Choristoneura fumiferana]